MKARKAMLSEQKAGGLSRGAEPELCRPRESLNEPGEDYAGCQDPTDRAGGQI